jgi:hypothetical protein
MHFGRCSQTSSISAGRVAKLKRVGTERVDIWRERFSACCAETVSDTPEQRGAVACEAIAKMTTLVRQPSIKRE